MIPSWNPIKSMYIYIYSSMLWGAALASSNRAIPGPGAQAITPCCWRRPHHHKLSGAKCYGLRPGDVRFRPKRWWFNSNCNHFCQGKWWYNMINGFRGTLFSDKPMRWKEQKWGFWYDKLVLKAERQQQRQQRQQGQEQEKQEEQ